MLSEAPQGAKSKEQLERCLVCSTFETIIRADNRPRRPRAMEQKFSSIWHEWHNYLVTWTRDRLPKLVIILLLAYVFARLLAVITRRIIAFSEKRAPGSAIEAQQVRTVVGVVRSVGVFLIV